MIDICYVGNSSLDNINTKNGYKKTIGGSAIYSSLSSRMVTNKSIAIISNINKEIETLLTKYNIKHFGNLLNEITEFNIDEEKGTCIFANKNDKPIFIEEPLEINNLHISFRKGVNIDDILNNPNINYDSLSVDVMIHSVEDFIPSLIKYNEKINTLFCNMEEYEKIRKYTQNIPKIIITNGKNPIIVIDEEKNYFYQIEESTKIVSSTGAGDSFIGGYIGAYCDGKNNNECINYGINTSKYSLENFGPLINIPLLDTFSVPMKIPKNILVIGNSCAGKTTFIDFFKTIFNIYSDIDDLNPLLEMFMIDDISRTNNIEDLKQIKEKIKYMNDIYEKNLIDFPNIDYYSEKVVDGNGHNIIKPILWDIILNKSVSIDKEKNNIIQFSRGKDELYENEFGNDVYKRSISEIIDALGNTNELLIINLTSDLVIRKARNNIRFENGGHFVSEDTMDSVYCEDIFMYEQLSENKGYIEINGIKYPVYTIVNNKMLSQIELNKFLMYNIKEIIEYYNDFGGKKYEYERSSKTNLAK